MVESTSHYVMVTLRGLESQETTSCHGVEARVIDRMAGAYFDVRDDDAPADRQVVNVDFCSSLTPYSTFTVDTYEENQLKLTGIVEDQDFIEGFKLLFLKLLCYYALDILAEDDRKMILYLGETLFNDLDLQKAAGHFPDAWSDAIGLKDKFDLSANTNDEESNKLQSQRVQDKKQPDNQKQKEKVVLPPKQDEIVDDIGMLLDDLDQELGNSRYQPPQQPYKQKDQPKSKPAIVNQDDDILGMLNDLDDNTIKP